MKKINLLFVCAFISVNLFSQTLQWAKKFDTQNANALFSSRIKLDNQNNIIISGIFNETIDFDLGPGVFTLTPTVNNFDIFFAKYSPAGNLIWAKKIACPNNYIVFGDFTIDKQNNILLTALVYDVVDVNPGSAVNNIGTMGQPSTFLAKYDASGNFMWVDAFVGNAIFSKISTDSQNKIIAAGKMYGTVDFDPSAAIQSANAPGNSNLLFIAQYATTGALSWVKTMGSASNFNEDVYDLHLDASSNIFIAGRYNGIFDFDPSAAVTSLNSQNKYVGYLAKYNASGNFIFARSFDCSGNSQVRNIRTDNAGNIILSGRFIGTLDLDASAGVLNVATTSANDIFITSYNAAGTIKWGFKIGNISDDVLANHEISPSGNIYVFGKFKGSVNFNPLGSAVNLSSQPSTRSDLFVASYNNNGALNNATKLGGNKNEEPMALTLNNLLNEMCLFGSFESTMDIDLSSATSSIAATGTDFFMSKYSFGSTFRTIETKEETENNLTSSTEAKISLSNEKSIECVLFPNPAFNETTLKITSNTSITSIAIYNMLGIKVKSFDKELDSANYRFEIKLDVNDLPKGSYFVIINNGQLSKRLIKE